MSPGISIAIPVPSGHRTPRERVLQAMQTARALGTPLSMDTEAGVAPGRLTREWVLDRRKRAVPTVGLIGACLIVMQSEAEAGEDPSGALARELGVSMAWVEGCGDAWGLESMSEHWLKADRQAYMDGFWVGCEALIYATLVCACGARRFKSQSTCDGCDR